MKVEEIGLKRYRTDLSESFRSAGGEIPQAEGLILTIKDQCGNTSRGEARIFEGLGTESLEQAEKAAQNLKLKGVSLSPENLREFSEKLSETPALRFAFETAYFLSKEGREFLNGQWKEEGNTEIPICGLVGLSGLNDRFERVRSLIGKGYKTIKIKAGKDLRADRLLLEGLRLHLGEDFAIRLDFNSSFKDRQEALNFLESIYDLGIEYAEDPLYDSACLIDGARIPIAFDRQINSLTNAKEIMSLGGKVLVLKPMIIGSVIETIEAMKLAKKNRVKAVLSSCFEASYGFRMLLRLCAISEAGVAQGLGTIDIAGQRAGDFFIKNGILSLSGADTCSE